MRRLRRAAFWTWGSLWLAYLWIQRKSAGVEIRTDAMQVVFAPPWMYLHFADNTHERVIPTLLLFKAYRDHIWARIIRSGGRPPGYKTQEAAGIASVPKGVRI